MRRDEFLARVAAALGRDHGAAPVSAAAEAAAAPEAGACVPPLPDPPPAAVVSPSTAALGTREELLERFEARSAALGVRVHRAAGPDAAERLAGRIVAQMGGSVCASGAPAARAACEYSGVPTEPPAEAEVGVTTAWRAVAETGTVVLRAEHGRLAGALPPVHVVLLDAADVRADLVSLYADVGGELPSALVQVTGPSRTADIEMTLTTGVHGPGTVVVVLYGGG